MKSLSLLPIVIVVVIALLVLTACKRDTRPYGGEAVAPSNPSYDTQVNINNPAARK